MQRTAVLWPIPHVKGNLWQKLTKATKSKSLNRLQTIFDAADYFHETIPRANFVDIFWKIQVK